MTTNRTRMTAHLGRGTTPKHTDIACPACGADVRIYEGDEYAKCRDCGWSEDIPADANLF